MQALRSDLKPELDDEEVADTDVIRKQFQKSSSLKIFRRQSRAF